METNLTNLAVKPSNYYHVMFRYKESYWLLAQPPLRPDAPAEGVVQVFENPNHAFKVVGGGPDIIPLRSGITFRIVEAIPQDELYDTWIGSRQAPFNVKTFGMKKSAVTGVQLHTMAAISAWEGGEEV